MGTTTTKDAFLEIDLPVANSIIWAMLLTKPAVDANLLIYSGASINNLLLGEGGKYRDSIIRAIRGAGFTQGALLEINLNSLARQNSNGLFGADLNAYATAHTLIGGFAIPLHSNEFHGLLVALVNANVAKQAISPYQPRFLIISQNPGRAYLYTLHAFIAFSRIKVDPSFSQIQGPCGAMLNAEPAGGAPPNFSLSIFSYFDR